MSLPEKVFVHGLKNYMLQLTDNRGNISFPPQKFCVRVFSLRDIATASILALIAAEPRTYFSSEHRYKPKAGVWKYTDIHKFVEENQHFFKEFLPSFKATPQKKSFDAITTKKTIRDYLLEYMNPEQFVELFIAWTTEVSKHYKSIKPCDRKAAMSGFNTKPKKVLIWAVHNWKQQNPEVEKIVKELFTSTTFNKVS